MTRLLVVFSLIAVLVSAVLVPSSAEAGYDPILSGSEYGISYDNGVYTISIDAERLAEILSSRSFNKETLKSVMPEAVYDLITDRDAKAATALLGELMETAQLGQLKNDLPLDYLTKNFSAEDFINIVHIDKLISLLDIKAIISSVPADEFENLFLEGKLEELLKSLDFTGILTDDKLEELLNILTAEEIIAALKPGAVDKLVHSGAVDLHGLMTKEIIQKVFDEPGIITDAEIEALLHDPTVVEKLIADDAVVDELLHHPDFMASIAAHENVIEDLITDEVIVDIFLKDGILDSFIEGLTPAQIKKIIFDYDVDIASFITPDVIASLGSDVIMGLVSDDDLDKLADLLTDDEIEEIVKDNDYINYDDIQLSDIYPQYITSDDIMSILSDDDFDKLSTYLSDSEKLDIAKDKGYLDLSLISVSDVYPEYITNDMIISSGVISPAEETLLKNSLSDTDALTIMMNKGYGNSSQITAPDVIEYLGAQEILDLGVLDGDIDTLAALVSPEDKATIAKEKGYLDTSKIQISDIYPAYITADEIKESGVVSSTDFDTLAGLLTPEEKMEIALDKGYVDTSKIDFSDIYPEYISAEEIKSSGIISDADMETLDPQVFFNAGLTPQVVFDKIENPAALAIQLYKDGVIDLNHVDFDEVANKLKPEDKTVIVEEIKKVPTIKEHVKEMILDDITILAHAVNIKQVYADGIITDNMILDAISSEDIALILEKDIISAGDIVANINDMPMLIDEIVIEKLPIDKILEVFPVEELVNEVMAQNLNGLLRALNLKYLLRLDAVEAELRDLTIAELRGIIDIDAIKNELIPKTIDLFLNDVRAIAINDHVVFIELDGFDIANLEYAMIDAIPTFDKIAAMDESGEAASFVIKSMIDGKIYNLGFKIRFTGDTTAIKEYASKLTEYVSFRIDEDRSITADLGLPAALSKLYIKAIDGDKLPAAIKTRLKDIANYEFNKSDIADLENAIISKLTIDELRQVLEAVDYKNLDKKLLAQLDLRESQAQLILNYAIKALRKGTDIVENHPETNLTLSSFYDKSLADFYVGEGTFNVNFDLSLDLMEKIEKIKELPAEIKGYLDNTTIAHNVDITVNFENLYKVEYVRNRQVIYTAFRTPGYDLSKVTTGAQFNGLGKNGWGTPDGTLVEVMPAEDITLSEIYLATFEAYDTDGTLLETFVIPFTEFINPNTDIELPVMPEREHYTFTWDDYKLSVYEDFTVKGYYEATEYTVTFMADGEIVAVETYTIEDTTIDIPEVPAKEHYTGAWEAFELNGGDITVNAEYTPVTYNVTFMADGQVVAVETYTIEDTTIDIPEVPAKEHYTGAWETFELNGGDVTVNAEYTPITYSVTFKADGQVVAVVEYDIENASITEPEVPAKAGYIGAWEAYTLQFNNTQVVNAVYTIDGNAETYYVTFVDENGGICGRVEFNRLTDIDSLTAPDNVPTKRGYNVYWPTDWKDNIFNEDIFNATGTYSFTVEAVYDIITYTATLPNGQTFTFTVLTKDSINLNSYLPAAPRGCRVEWTISVLPLADVTLEYRYVAIDYYVVFLDENDKVVKTVPFTIFTTTGIKAPAVPAKIGYTGIWDGFDCFVMIDDDVYDLTGSYSRTFKVKYTPIKYYATFVDKDGKEIAKVPFTVEDKTITAPAAPTLAGYNVTWPAYELFSADRYKETGSYNLTIKAEYAAIKYSVTFKADGKDVAILYYTVENKTITEPAVPAKEGYTGKWEAYTLDIGDKVVNAVYTKIDTPPVDEEDKYYITFVDWDGNVIEKIEFTKSTDPSTIKAPATIPEKAGYNVSWPSFTLFDEKRFEETGTYSFTVKAVYEPIEYTATFMADGKVIAEVPFTVESKTITEPAIPAKAGYTGAWSSYTLGTEDITIDAIYSTISYKVTFVADGEEVAVLYYTVENREIDEPEVPAKEGFTGAWEDYTLDMGDKTVNAVYTPVEEAAGASIFWWIMIGVLVVAAVVLVTIFLKKTKKKDDPADDKTADKK